MRVRGTTSSDDRRRRRAAWWSCAAVVLLAGSARGQGLFPRADPQINALNPVFADESAIARETLGRVREFLTAGNTANAVRELQRLLDEQADRMVPAAEPGLYLPARAVVHRLLLERGEVLRLYRDNESAAAQRLLDSGEAASVERSRLLTPAGFDAAVRVALEQVGAASFEAARLTLEPLEKHPDRSGVRGVAAAEAATLVARYLDRAEVWAWAERWRKEAGVSGEMPRAFPRPVALAPAEWTSSSEAPDLLPAGVPERPLWSTRLEPESLPDDPAQLREPDLPVEQIVDNQWVVPAVVGDTIYINDGTFVTARDRYTLTPRWAVRPVSEGAEDPFVVRRLAATRSQGRQVEDLSTVSVIGGGSGGGTLVATMGMATAGGRDGAVATVALDTQSGRVLWSVEVDRLGGPEAGLDGGSVRGPALIDPMGGGTVVLCVRRPTLGRRTVSQVLVGLDLETGSLRWVRPIAAAGSIPWGGGVRGVGFVPVLHQGMVYTLDTLGVAAAVEAATGRTRWVRTMPSPSVPMGFAGESRLPWMWMEPIVDAEGGGLVTLSPDRSRVMRLSLADGSVVASRAAAELGEPQYLLRAGDRLAAVSGGSVAFVGLGDLERGVVRRIRVGESGSVRGRLLSGPTGVYVPRLDGLAFYPLPVDERAVEPSVLRLERPGTVVALADQVFTLDATSVHNYLSFEMADARLAARMKADPSDPEPAVTAAELAYHANKPERIAASADVAIRAIEADPQRAASIVQRERLLVTLSRMVDESQARWDQPRPGAEAKDAAAASAPASIDLPWMGEVLVRVGRLSQTPTERASHLLALGRFEDASGRPGLGIQAYQRVLAEAALASSMWSRGGVTARADLEATRRIRTLASEHGPSVYAAFDAEAGARIAGLGAAPTLEALESLAREFPASRSAALALVRASELHESAGRGAMAAAALREAMEIAEFTMDGAGGAADPALGLGVGPGLVPGVDRGLEPGLGEIAGRLLTLLDRQDKLFSASQVLSRMRQNHPGIALSVRGAAIDEGALSERIAARLATLQRLPRIGSRVVGEPTVLSGWSVVAPRGRAHVGRSSEHVVLINASQNRIGLFMGGSSASEPMVKAWDRSFTQSAPVVLRYDAQTVDLVWESSPAHAAGQSIGMGPVIERIEASSGRTLWFSSGLSELLPVREDAPELARRGELVVAVDESVVVVADRVGRVAGLDAATGRTLWRRQTPVLAVADVACGAGVVAVGGLSGEIGAPRARPVVVVLDAKRGEIVQRMDDLVSPVRWVRMSGVESGAAALVGPGERAGSPAIIAGLNTAVVSFDPSTGRPNWSIAGSPAASALDAFVFGSRLFLLDGNRQLWLASVATGQTTPRPLQSMDHFLGTQLEATALPGGRTLFASERGVCVFDERGELAGIDGLDLAGDMTVVPALATGGGFLTIESGLRPGDTGYRLHLLDAASAKLVWTRSVVGLDVPPRRIAVIDGRLLVSAGGNVIVLAMPEGS